MRVNGGSWTRRPILLATDGSSTAARARVVAVDLCLRSGAPLHIVHGWGFTEPYRVVTATTDEEVRTQLRSEARDLVAHEAAVAAAGGVAVSGEHVVHDRPAASVLLVAHTVNPALVVMGSRGRGAVRRAVLGSVSERMVQTSTHPVLIVREDCPWPVARVVVGDDGSTDADRAAVLGAQLAAALGVEVTLVHGRRGQAHRPDGIPAHEWLAERAAALEAAHGCTVASRVSDDAAVGAILSAAADPAALVVLGAHSHALQVPGRGRTSTAVLRQVRMPVLVVPPPHPAWTPAAREPAEVAR